jgi:hypothetical protein
MYLPIQIETALGDTRSKVMDDMEEKSSLGLSGHGVFVPIIKFRTAVNMRRHNTLVQPEVA